ELGAARDARVNDVALRPLLDELARDRLALRRAEDDLARERLEGPLELDARPVAGRVEREDALVALAARDAHLRDLDAPVRAEPRLGRAELAQDDERARVAALHGAAARVDLLEALALVHERVVVVPRFGRRPEMDRRVVRVELREHDGEDHLLHVLHAVERVAALLQALLQAEREDERQREQEAERAGGALLQALVLAAEPELLLPEVHPRGVDAEALEREADGRHSLEGERRLALRLVVLDAVARREVDALRRDLEVLLEDLVDPVERARGAGQADELERAALRDARDRAVDLEEDLAEEVLALLLGHLRVLEREALVVVEDGDGEPGRVLGRDAALVGDAALVRLGARLPVDADRARADADGAPDAEL